MLKPFAVEQEVFELILVHNKLMSKEDIRFFFKDTPNPEDAVRRLVASNFIEPGVAEKLMAVYRKKLAKVLAEAGGREPAPEPDAPPAAGARPAAPPRPATAAPVSPVSAAPVSAAPAKPSPQSGTQSGPQPGSAPSAGKPAAAGGAVKPALRPAASAGAGVKETSRDPGREAVKEAGRGAVAVAEEEALEGAIEVEGFTVEKAPKEAAKVRTVSEEEIVGPLIDVSEGGKRLTLTLLQAARDLGASDIYIKSNSPAIVRLFTVLRRLNMDPVPDEVIEKSLFSILNEDQLKHFKEHNDLDFSFDGGPGLGRFRVNFFRQHRGMDGVFRLISNKVPTFDELKLPDVVRKLTQYRVGVVLITGPKSSGKTTTVAAMVDLINSTRKEHVITVEDPIEFVQPCKMGHVNQREVGPHTKTFANALRAALREAPDVILVGEMRDLETTSLAITAAETGHLVMSTLHTPDAVRTIGRVLDVFPPREQPQIRAMVSESLRGVVSQQLVPNAQRDGMELALEIMVNTTAIANLIREDRAFQIGGTIQTGKKWGMRLMDESLISLAKEGRIRREDAVVRATNRALVKRELNV